MDFRPRNLFSPDLQNPLATGLVLFKKRMEGFHDGIGVGKVVNMALLLIKLNQGLIITVFGDVIFPHHNFFHIGVSNDLSEGLGAVIFINNFEKFPFSRSRLQK